MKDTAAAAPVTATLKAIDAEATSGVAGKTVISITGIDYVKLFADKNVNVSIQHIFAHARGNDGRQSMETFSHVDRMAKQKIPALF